MQERNFQSIISCPSEIFIYKTTNNNNAILSTSFLPKLSLESTPCLLRTFITLGGEGVAKKKTKKKVVAKHCKNEDSGRTELAFAR